ncbi:MAG: tyrosine-type recombinase/integrase [Candidatus Peribacteria bacterium]|nr:MAG: tyrosine-type recombinase/integrase [Candidatus Peribacteria bacterium]
MTENEKLHYFRKLLINQHFSPKTVKSYTQSVKSFFLWYKQEGEYVDDMTLTNYLMTLVASDKASKTINVYKEALKKYFLLLYNRTFDIALKLSREPRSLPVVLSTQEVSKLIEVTTNPKHALLLSLAYGCGLRISEIVNLRWNDIDGDRYTIHIKHGKGAKDRVVILPQSTEEQLARHRKSSPSSPYVFYNDQ